MADFSKELQSLAQEAIDEPIGAVMVIGGGIAGMQASLDLADQGFKVYLVESQMAIGGKMAQLDKTFPTNDCAMCTLSPRLVEIGRHPNIQIVTEAEVQGIYGKPGNFLVHLQHAPKYIDPLRCVGCGDCTKVCPVIVKDAYNEGLSYRHAAYKLYPQAIPNVCSIEKLGISPCRDACPAGQRAQGYIALIREGRWQDAIRVIKIDNPFPGICGRICNHRCEDACNRGLVDEPINIRALKRFVTDKVYAEPRQPVQKAQIKHPDKKVAIIGAGPCGLTAAQDIIQAGFPVTVFEAMPVAGGMLRLGVPEFRLPTAIVEREIADIIDQGVDLRLNHQVENLDDLFEAGYSAVLIAVGAHEGVRLPIPGANLEGVLINTVFLRDVRLNRYIRSPDGGVTAPDGSRFGPRVLVLGGGNVAIDVARTAVRLGCKVAMACLESRSQMPAHEWEIEAALSEGIQIFNRRSFERIFDDGTGHVAGVECMEVTSFSFDDVGRLAVEKLPGSSHVLTCDHVIFSVGQRAGLAFIPEDSGVGLTQRRTIAINPNTFAATRPGVFAAGDSVSGTAYVIEAVHSGHQAAESILRYLRGEDLERPAKPILPVVKFTRQEVEERIRRGEIQRKPRVPLPVLPVDERKDNFFEVEGGYDDESAQAEAARCLACGVCSECLSCVYVCGTNAINHDAAPTTELVRVGAVILTPGYQIYQAESAAEFGLGRYPNVVTSLQFERLLSASGPTLGQVKRPSDGSKPNSIAFLQCIGSRDQEHDYCSSVCCMYATKEAIIAKEHDPDLEIHIFLMDMRAFSKGYWGYFERARDQYHVHYVYCRISSLKEDPCTHNLYLEYLDEHGKRCSREFDLVVLSVGMEIPLATRQLAKRLDIALTKEGFCQGRPLIESGFNPLETSRPGIYVAGAFRGPKDIPEAVVEGSAAAAAAAGNLSAARFRLTASPTYPEERNVRDEPVRIGVFICHCGSNIAGYLDIGALIDFTKQQPGVVHVEANLYTCSQDSIRHITAVIQEKQLNRVVVASCTPRTHAPLFQDSLRAAGLNPFLFEMANIRNQCSWVHSHEWDIATDKAKDLIRMSVNRVALLQSLPTFEIPNCKVALVVGGGPAGMSAALSLAEQGYPVHLVEKEAELGGKLKILCTPMPDIMITGNDTSHGETDPRQLSELLIKKVRANPLINVHLESQVVQVEGFTGNFKAMIESKTGHRSQVNYGIAILATGGEEYKGNDYGYGTHEDILTQLEFEYILKKYPADGIALEHVVMIQCVGPAERFCSRICCTTALKNALAIKHKNPDAQVSIFYRDIRTYGLLEHLYREARRQGILFIRYSPEKRPQVMIDEQNQGALMVNAWEPITQREMILRPNYIVLSMPVIPNLDTHQLASSFKVPVDENGFFQEAHIKLRPVDFASSGVFMSGVAHYPKLLSETLIQAHAAVARAGRILAQDTLKAGGRVAVVDQSKCTACLTCVRICPFRVPVIQKDHPGAGGIQGSAYIEASVCQGCGVCAAECPARAIQLMHFTDSQLLTQVIALSPTQPMLILME